MELTREQQMLNEINEEIWRLEQDFKDAMEIIHSRVNALKGSASLGD